MKLRIFSIIFALIPCFALAATRDGGRVGVRRAPTAVGMTAGQKGMAGKNVVASKTTTNTVAADEDEEEEEEEVVEEKLDKESCRTEYRECMDDFCALDESEGGRCSCSDNIKLAKPKIQEIQSIQAEAEKLYSEGVEKERLGAKARFVFGESEKAKRSSRASGIDLVAWVNGNGADSLDADYDIGSNLYSMAEEACQYVLDKCDEKIIDGEVKTYQREISRDCKAFDSYLAEQKSGAESNKATAEAAVRSARLDMFGTTNKYNRGECLLAYRACIADKGGCGVNFENCLDEKLLSRRANACEDVLDQCTASKKDVLADWKDESRLILKEAAKYTDENMRLTCRAKIRNCLEEGCSASYESANASTCLSNINVAAGICPIIDECDAKVPGLKRTISAELSEMRTHFCQNDVDKCLKDKCGVDFNAPECLGKKANEIAKLCPQTMFTSCSGESQYNIIVQSILLHMDYQMIEGCKNYYADALGRVCGTDMNCLPSSEIVAALEKYPNGRVDEIHEEVKAESKKAVDEFFKTFEKESTVSACMSSTQPSGSGRKSLKDSMTAFAKLAAQIGAENRYLTDLNSKLAKLSLEQDAEEGRQNCLSQYKVESKPKTDDKNQSYTYIKSVSYEKDLRNCHVCRLQRVCETGGEKKATSALKAGFGGLTAGASAGTMVSAGWGTAIGAAIGGAAGAIGGAMSGGQEEFCQEIESCEDINM